MFVHLATDHEAERNLQDDRKVKDVVSTGGCPLLSMVNIFWLRQGKDLTCSLVAVLVGADPRGEGVPGQCQAQMKTLCCFPSNSEAGGSFPLCINLLKHDGNHIRSGDYLSLQFIH